ncbi:hypothetical protein [Melittangium boletus]|uniref:hypothetical protein n=1 Tax=Melittangium boletus TaxID=83453 RepID=UPI001C54C5E6|nr:hypothetical protein [Melittangium boletus]
MIGRSVQGLSQDEGRGAAGDMHQTVVPMSLAVFQSLVSNSSRCGTTNVQLCVEELDYAYSQGLLSYDAYVWGLQRGYYPYIDRSNNIAAVCNCWGAWPSSGDIVRR